MKKRGLFRQALFGMACMLITGLASAATIEATVYDGDAGVGYSLEFFALDLTAYNLSNAGSNTPLLESFSLNSYNDGSGNYAGTLSIGSLLSADFTNLTYTQDPFGGGAFSADLTYTAGSLMGSYTGGVLNGTFSASGNVIATVAEVQAVPVPAAVWLFASGLLGLVGVARRQAG